MDIYVYARTWLNVAGLVAAVGFSGAASAVAIPVGPGPGPGTTTQHTFQADYGAWFVADLDDPVTPAPIEVTIVGAAGRWTQEFLLDDSDPAPQIGDEYLVQELIRFDGGDLAFDNWHQVILTPGWQWSDAAVFDNTTAAPLAGLQITITTDSVAFRFDPLASGTDLFILKTLTYVGSSEALPLRVQAFAVPEPQTYALLAAGLGLVLLIGARRNRRL
ncbi:MAG: PEP-CTERM sorting domain-containing protein [Burkholderiales bacterium]|nr:PEP-CTERM sorting domain-containing protein [Burkholderiales bacterium]